MTPKQRHTWLKKMAADCMRNPHHMPPLLRAELDELNIIATAEKLLKQAKKTKDIILFWLAHERINRYEHAGGVKIGELPRARLFKKIKKTEAWFEEYKRLPGGGGTPVEKWAQVNQAEYRASEAGGKNEMESCWRWRVRTNKKWGRYLQGRGNLSSHRIVFSKEPNEFGCNFVVWAKFPTNRYAKAGMHELNAFGSTLLGAKDAAGANRHMFRNIYDDVAEAA